MLPNEPSASGITLEESRGGFLTGIAVARRLLQKKPEIRITFLSSDAINPEAETWARHKQIPFVSKQDGYNSLIQSLKQSEIISGKRAPLAFIVHGHDSSMILELKNFIQNTLKWQEPICEQPSSKTIIEKFEDNARK